MLFRTGQNWVLDFFVSHGWLVKRRRLRRRKSNWNLPSSIPAECLEDRTLLSTITVTGLTDGTSIASGVTLRDAIEAANTDSSVNGSVAGEAGVQNVIVFQPGLTGSIALARTLGALTISSSMKIEGLGAPVTSINAGVNSRVFDITSSAGNVELDGLTVTNGKTTGSSQSGGGICFLSSGTLTLANTAINYNYTSGPSSPGAAVYTQSGNLTILDSTISNNVTSGSASSGGAIFSQSGAVTLVNSTISGNKNWGDSSDGAAIYTLNDSAAVTLTNSTVSGNKTYGTNADGGAITVVGGSITLANSIVSGNQVGVGNDVDIKFINVHSTATFAAHNSLVGVNSGTPLAAAAVGTPDANGNLVGTTVAPLNAKLGLLANNGGPTQTMALLAGSPALNAGNNSLAVDASNAALTTDQRGAPFQRIFGAAVDMGAFETQSISLVVTSANDQLDAIYNPAQLTLRDALFLTNASSGANTITFSSSISGTPINLTLGNLVIDSAVTITGDGAKNSIINAQQLSRVFYLGTGAGNVTLSGLTITGGATWGNNSYGAGILSDSTGTLTVTDCAITRNLTTGYLGDGAGIFTKSGPLVMTNSTISGNATTGERGSGAGIYAVNSSVSLANCTLSGNTTAGYRAGCAAILTLNSDAPLTLTNCTVSGNANNGSNAAGGALYIVRGSITVTNSIVSGNTIVTRTSADISFENYDHTGVFTAKNSLIGIDGATPLNPAPVGSPDANGNLVGTSASPLDAKLGPLAYNGGQTQTMALLAGSPAIDAGNSSLAVAPDSTPLTADQRGVPFARISGAAVDMGAYESQTVSLVVNSSADTLDAVYNPAHVTLRDAVAFADAYTGASAITFAAALNGTPIDLTLGQLTISANVTITGNGAQNTIIDAQQNSRVLDVSPGAENVTLNGLTITGGETTASNAYGAGIQFLSSGSLTIESSAVAGNTTSGFLGRGAGIYTNTGAVTLLNSTISGNSTTGKGGDGAGIFSQHGAVTLANATISGDSTVGYHADGVAIYTQYADAAITLTNSTVSGNINNGGNATGAAVSAVRASITLANSIVSGNTISAGTTPDVSFGNYSHQGTFIAKNSLVGVNSGTPLNPAPVGSPDANGNFVGTFASPLSAHLGPLAYNGGQTQTMVLLAGSPAINAGSNALAIDPTTNNPLTTDQRGAGFARIVGTVDMGAYEVQVLAVPTVNFLATSSHLPTLTGTYDQQNTVLLQVTVNGSTFTLGTSPQLTSDGSGNWKLTTTVAIPDGTYNVVVLETDPSGDQATDTTTNDLVVNTVAPATTSFTGEYAVASQGSNVLSLASITQNGVNLTLVGSSSTSATVVSTTQLSVGGVTATYGGSVITFGVTGTFANQVWTKLDVPANYTNQGGAAVQIIQSGASLTFVNKLGQTSAGHWISPTQFMATDWGSEIGTLGDGIISWSVGVVWSENLALTGTQNGSGTTSITATPSPIYVSDYINPGGLAVHLVQTGTNNVVIIDATGHMSQGAFINSTQFSTPYFPGQIATISGLGDTITWSGGTLWTQTARTSAITLTNYTNQFGVPVHLIQNGTNQLAFVDALGRTALGTLNGSTVQNPIFAAGVTGTLGANSIVWSNQYVWTKTNVVPLLIALTDASGNVSHAQLTSATTLVGLDGTIKGLTATRLNGKLFWSNGDVWGNFDLNALNALFEMATGYP